MKYVIVGAGAAGVSAARTIKEIDSLSEVVLIGSEGVCPYNRYLLTDFLCDFVGEDNIMYTSPDFFKELGIKLRKGEKVKAINPQDQYIKLFHNEIVPYDKLLLATGGSPSLGPVLQPYQKMIQQYYTLEDIQVLKKKLPNVDRCIVSGEGLSSLDLLRGLVEKDKEITYIIKDNRPNWSLVEPDLYREMESLLVEKGIKILTEDRITSIEEEDGVYRVGTLAGKNLEADIVFAWRRYRPNIDLASGTHIEKKLGILVDKYMKTSEANIYAAGDCVEIYHPAIRSYWINFGWPNAVEQGKIAGMNMAGHQETYKVREVLTFNLMGKSLKARWWK